MQIEFNHAAYETMKKIFSMDCTLIKEVNYFNKVTCQFPGSETIVMEDRTIGGQ